MEQQGIVHANVGIRPDAFWRTFLAMAMGVGILAGVALAIGPIALLVAHPQVWMLVPLVLVPLGGWIAVKTAGHARKLRWHYAHLPEFVLFADRIESAEWPNPLGKGARIPTDDAPRRRVVDLGSVTSVVVSFCLVRQTRNRYGIPANETAPILYVRYRDRGWRNLLSVPFPSHATPGVDRWLAHVAARGIPLRYTARILFRHDTQILDDAGRLADLDGARDLLPYRFSNGWLADKEALGTAWLALQETHRAEEEALDPALKDARSKHPLTKWISQGLVFVWLGMVPFLLAFPARQGALDPTNATPGIAAVVLFGLLFFHLLRSRLRWPYIFIYSAGALATGIMVLIGSVELSAAEQGVGAAFFLATLVFQPFCWVPYLVVKKLAERRGNNARREYTVSTATRAAARR
ncbi:hypothetical protein [Arthrobacter halodurans]|uniref:Uncharacterized protein n=1 Tax=Arthrobacter halodurans TaxID=516699 RepID=A0ABV4USZ1_9MICC